MSLRAEGEAIPFLRLLRSLSLPRNDKLFNAFVLEIITICGTSLRQVLILRAQVF